MCSSCRNSELQKNSLVYTSVVNHIYIRSMLYETPRLAAEIPSPGEVLLRNKLEAAYTRMQDLEVALQDAETDLAEMRGVLAKLGTDGENAEARNIVGQIESQVDYLRSAYIASAKIYQGIQTLRDQHGSGDTPKRTLN